MVNKIATEARNHIMVKDFLREMLNKMPPVAKDSKTMFSLGECLIKLRCRQTIFTIMNIFFIFGSDKEK